MPLPAHRHAGPNAFYVGLEALEGLQCGCVTVAYRCNPSVVVLVQIEAKGPHCILEDHKNGCILRETDPSEFDEEFAE